MTEKQIIEMLKELINEIDYDIYKEMFVYEELDDLPDLVKIVQKHVEPPKIYSKPQTKK